MGVLSVLYRGLTGCRNRLYDRGLLKAHSAGVPVLSVGNLTVGGTGKTPFVVWLADTLKARGVSPAVLSRGYRARGGGESGADQADPASDEVAMMRSQLAEVPVVVGADRVASGVQAVQEGAGALILDDGFQHRRLRRDVDLVLVDATCPFGYDNLLPRGLLREAKEGLERASAVVVTRADQIAPGELTALRTHLSSLVPGRPIAEAVHRPVEVCSLIEGTTNPPGWLSGRRILLVSGVGNPDAFRKTAEGLGCEILRSLVFPDHHLFTAADSSWIRYQTVDTGADLVLTTEKDVARGEELVWAGVETAFLRVRLEVVRGQEDLLEVIEKGLGV